jgi:2-C-methyl-D-erythritol 4-phosphate cytidylyltransferase/2-C-methyl-D-erythritol 2,4-cyclodiphosphate synthase
VRDVYWFFMHVSAIIAAAGRGARFGSARPKQLLTVGGVPILQRSVEAFTRSEVVDEVVVALPADVAANPPAYLTGRSVGIVAGGERRQDSVSRAFERIDARAEVVVVHDAARPFVTADLIRRTVEAAARFGAAIAALPARDTVKRAAADRVIAATLPRQEIFLAQTPQAFRVEVLRDALARSARTTDATDEAMLAEQAGHPVRLVDGDARNIKITTPDDLAIAESLAGGTVATTRIGNGYDLHRLVDGRPLVLGGVTIPYDRGLKGHSDADAVCHAVTDAILGAAGAGDIGRHFPDDDPAWKDANSLDLLRRAAAIVGAEGFRVVNVDVVVIAEAPRLARHADAMIANLAGALGCPPGHVSVKGKTNEGVDSMGAGASIAVHAVALVSRAG